MDCLSASFTSCASFLCLLPRSSLVSVVFVFNASLNDVVFPFPILLSFGVIGHTQNETALF